MGRATRSVLSHAAAFLCGAFLALLASNAAYVAVYSDDHARGLSSSSSAPHRRTDGGGGGTEEERRMEEVEEARIREGGAMDEVSAGGGAAPRGGGTSSTTTTALRGRLSEGPRSGKQEEDRDDDDYNDDDDLCSVLPRPTPTTLSLWSSQLHRIVNATQHSADRPDYIFHDFTALLLHFMTPDRLQRSVKTLPLDWTPVERCMDVIQRRLVSVRADVVAYMRKNGIDRNDDVPPEEMRRINDDPKHTRKLNVVVMGGSVTMGVVCHLNPATTQTGKYSRRACAWPGRMADFFYLLSGGYDMVHFHTLALGGTNSESGSVIWDYSLLPDDMPYPDVVINAYATNDMHYNSVQDAIARNVTLAESLLSLGQDFVRKVLTPKGGECDGARRSRPPPLLLYLDDYLGNEQNEVMTTMLSSQTINLLSGYYGLGSMSYGDAVRDVVYGDTREWWFSANWYEKGYGRAVHPHMGMHISMVWLVAFNLMNLVTTYCSLPVSSPRSSSTMRSRRRRRHHAGVEGTSDGAWDYGYVNRSIYGVSLRSTKELVGGPRQKPRGIPPPLTPELSLEHITNIWREDSDKKAHLWETNEECMNMGNKRYDDDAGDDDAPLPRPCVFSWVANLERHLDNPKRLNDKVGQYVTSNEGWSAVDDNNKLGWVPSSGLGSKFTMEFKRISQPVRAVTWMIMRSYGERWEGSLLNVEVWSGETLLARKDIEGYHDKRTSETYNIKMRLDGVDGDDKHKEGVKGAVVGSDLRIKFELVGGSTFKISGMAICDH